jgi:transcriptional regulator of arginine metabolism
MENKIKRLTAIRNILSKEKIDTQETLLGRLKKKGFDYTQATLSRDLKLLKVAKILDLKGGYRIILQENFDTDKNETTSKGMQVENIISIAFSGNIAVVKTFPGYASTIGVAFDNLDFFEIIGSVAGDDTLLLIIKEDIKRSYFINVLLSRLPKLKNLLISK